MNVGEAKTALKAYGFDDSDPLLTWLTVGMRMVEEAADWPWLITTQSINASSGDSTLALAATALKLYSVRDMTNNRKLKYIDRVGFDRDIVDHTTTGKGIHYTLFDLDVIQLWPVLDSAATYRVIYQTELSDPGADGSAFPGPVRTHFVAVQYAASIALQVDNEEERAATAMAEADRRIDLLKRKFGSPVLDEPRTVTDVMGYGEI